MVAIYKTAPIDRWDGWIDAEDFDASADDDAVTAFEAFFEDAKEAAFAAGWEGDVAVGPFLVALPDNEGGFSRNFIIGWKQANNGITFIASPVELPWMGPRAGG